MRRIRGFTLVELLVVISIIGILASIVTVNANAARRQSRDTKRKADIQNVAGALELYRATNRIYPTVQSYAGLDNLLKGFTSNIPSDPGSFSYTYTADATGAHFVLDAQLETTSETPAFPCPSQQSSADFFKTAVCGPNSGPFHYRVAGP